VVPTDGDVEVAAGVEVIRCRTLAEAIAVAQSNTKTTDSGSPQGELCSSSNAANAARLASKF
jgi:hypothetical protein